MEVKNNIFAESVKKRIKNKLDSLRSALSSTSFSYQITHENKKNTLLVYINLKLVKKDNPLLTFTRYNVFELSDLQPVAKFDLNWYIDERLSMLFAELVKMVFLNKIS